MGRGIKKCRGGCARIVDKVVRFLETRKEEE